MPFRASGRRLYKNRQDRKARRVPVFLHVAHEGGRTWARTPTCLEQKCDGSARRRLGHCWPAMRRLEDVEALVAGIDLGFEDQVGPHVFIAGAVGMQEESAL